jgi:primosomal protein N'
MEVCQMQKQVTVALQTVCDLSMQDYVESEQSVDEQNKIADKIAELRDSLNPQQKQLLNQLLDDINNSDSRFSYEVFTQGVLFGMSLITNTTVA